MDAIRDQLARLQAQLAGLTASQKMLAGALVAIMAITVLWWADKAAAPELQPVLDQPLTAEEMGPIRHALAGANLPFVVQGDRLMVPADRQLEAISVMGMGNVLPRNPSAAFESMVERMSAWDSSLKTGEYLQEAKRRYLCEIIGGFPDVSRADVVLGLSPRRRIGKTEEPTAAVAIQTRGGRKLDADVVEGAVNVVCGLIPGLDRGRVKVTVNGHRQQVADPAGHLAAAGDLFAQRAQAERHYEQKIYAQFDFMPRLVASVTVEIDATRRERRSHTVDPDQVVAAPRSESSRTSESSGGGAAVEPGAVPNTGGSVWDTMYGGGSESSTTEAVDVENYVDHSRTEEFTVTPAGTPRVVAAAVRVPWSHVRREWQRLFGNDDAEGAAQAKPTPEQLDQVEQRVLANVRADVVACTNIADASLISVNTYADDAPPPGAAAAAEAAGFLLPGGVSPIAILSNYGKPALLTIIAAGAVLAVLRMVAKSGPVVTSDIPNLEHALAQLRGEMAVGEVGEDANVMDGADADPETIEAKQMVEQVQQLVGENPEAAANLVRRWLDS